MPLRPASARPLLPLPEGLDEVAAFSVDRVRTWGGGSAVDAAFKEEVREQSGVAGHHPDGRTYLFAIRVYWQQRRTTVPRQRPDIENVAKLITDAFIGVLYEDDDLRFVCGVQSECFGVPDSVGGEDRDLDLRGAGGASTAGCRAVLSSVSTT